MIRPNPRRAIEFRKRPRIHDIPADAIVQIGLPVPPDSTGKVALFVRARIDVHLNESHFWVIEVLSGPVGTDKGVGMRVVTHEISPEKSAS